MAVVLWVGAKSRAAAVKREPDSENASDSVSEGRHSHKSAFESLFNEFMAYPDTQETDPVDSFVSSTEESNGSYSATETVVEPLSAQQTAQPSVVSSVEEPNAEVAFDLRQAVIYQTILSNKYLDEIRTQDN